MNAEGTDVDLFILEKDRYRQRVIASICSTILIRRLSVPGTSAGGRAWGTTKAELGCRHPA